MILSYLKSSEHTVKLENCLHDVKISRVNDDIARVYFVQADTNEEVSIPVGCVFRNLTTGNIVTCYHDEWLISWTSNYELKLGDTVVLNIDFQRQQAISSQ